MAFFHQVWSWAASAGVPKEKANQDTQDFLLFYLAHHLSLLSKHFHLVVCSTYAGMMDVLGSNKWSKLSTEEKQWSYRIIRLFLAGERGWIVSSYLAFPSEA